MGFSYNVNVLNQKGSPAIYTDTFANRPSPGYAGRLFISSDTSAIYEDTGTAWTLIANVSSGAGTLEQVTTNGNTTTKGISISAGGLSTNSLTDTALTLGSVLFAGAAGLVTQDNAAFFFDDTNNRLGINTTTPTNTLDLHYAGTGSTLGINNTAGNQSAIVFVNTGANKWRIGNSATNTFDIYNSGTGTNAISIDSSTNLVSLIGALTAAGSITSQVNNSNFGTSANGQIPIIIQSNNTARAIRLKNSAAGYSEITVTGTASSSTFGINTFSTADAFRINDDGTVGIGNTNGTVGKLNVTGRIALTTGLFFSSNLTAEDRWEINGGSSTNLTFTRSGVAEYMRLSNGGNLLINSTTDDTVNKLQVTGSVKATGPVKFNTNGNIVYGNGNVANTTKTVTISTTSLNGSLQINLGCYNNGTAAGSNAMWICGGYGNSGMLATQITRNNGSGTTISAITSNVSSLTFTILSVGSTDVSIVLISGDFNGATPTITIA